MDELDLRYEAVSEHMVANEPMFHVGTKVIGGVELKVFDNAPQTMRDYYAIGAMHEGADFLVYEDERYSYAQVLQLVANFSHVLLDRYGIKKGDRVAIAMRNYPEWIVAFMAITSIGAIAVPMNGWWTTDEFDYGLEDSGAKLVLADRERVERIHPLMDNLGLKMISVRMGPSDDVRITRYEDLMDGLEDQAQPDVPIDPEDDATILYTSGSTGYPKGAVSSHRGILSALFSWALAGLSRAAVVAEEAGADAPEPLYQPATLMTIPLFHVTGCHSIYLLSMVGGRKIVLAYKWDAEEALQLIEKERITNFNGVPTMSWELLQSPNIDKYDLSSLQDLSGGGAARPPEHVKLLREKFPDKDPAVGYGLTETNALGAVSAGTNYLIKPGSTGKPLGPLLEMKLVDEDNEEVATGERGEILIKGPQNVRGYWNKPEATAEAFSKDGWFRTGDIGVLDEDGFLYIVDRAKDIVIRGGENISCLEVEAAIYQHPDVLEAAVFGVPDERLGEEVAVMIAVKSGRNPDPESIKHFLADHLAKFKVPRYVWLQSEKLPRIASGKIYKKQIREDAVAKNFS